MPEIPGQGYRSEDAAEHGRFRKELESAYRAGREDEARSQAASYEPFVASGPVEQELDFTSEAFEAGRRAGREDAARDIRACVVGRDHEDILRDSMDFAADVAEGKYEPRQIDLVARIVNQKEPEDEDQDTPEGRT